MTDRPVSPITGQPFKVQNYYMQIMVINLFRRNTLTKQDANFSFSIFKGDQEFQSSDQFTITRDKSQNIPLQKIRVDFVVISYNPKSSHVFCLKLIQNLSQNHSKVVGEYELETNQYIDQYLQTQNGAFTLKISLNDQFSADLQLYIDKSQYGLQRLIRDIKNPKAKKQNDLQSPKVTHQRITQLRRRMDEQAKLDNSSNHHQQKFKKFSPKRDVSQDKKKSQYLARKKQQEDRRIRQIEEEEKRKREQEQRKKKETIKPKQIKKREWIIPEAEKFMAETKVNRRVVRKESKSSDKETKDQKTKSELKDPKKNKPQPRIEELSFFQKIPINPKILISVTVIIIAAGIYFLFIKNDTQPESSIPTFPKPQKVEKNSKGTGKAKSKKSKK